jgi:pyruvate/2-oxoglutarate dehydrogenase complex dihydrolipoamide acyltransferase (E2) component
MSQSIEVQVPDIGDFAEVEVIEILVKPGDTIALEQSLITVESDKASMEIPSAAAGVVREIRVKLGDKVAKGSVVLTVEPVSAPDMRLMLSADFQVDPGTGQSLPLRQPQSR